MSIQTSSKLSKSTLLAVGAAALILSGCAGAGTKTADSGSSVACVGVNSCKGQSECKTAGNACKGHNACKTATNACKGQNDCKSHGHMALTGAECTDKGGHAA